MAKRQSVEKDIMTRPRKIALAAMCLSLALGGVASAQPAPVAPVATPRVIMIRMFVSDLPRGEKFYHEVLGTTVVRRMGDNVAILTFPGGALPGIIMIKSPQVAQMKSSFVIQVPDMEAALARGAANGGTAQSTRFAEAVQGMPAASHHLLDPDGNDIEVLQIGKSK